MQTQPEIQFQGLNATPAIRDAIDRHVMELEQRWGRITSLRVVVKAPSQHRHKGGLYEVHVRLTLPDGREVNVERTPTADERHADPTFAIDDAFKHARRQLQDQVDRMQGQVKHRDGPPVGTVARLDPSGEFGFIEGANGQDIYFHRNSVLDDGFGRLHVGLRVTYAEEPGEKGMQASTVRLIGKHKLRA
jgi:cold shock CspA family protein/ribosome-associated translation inhibitor RaiA